jgi:uncharacterized protein with von Willebrand factor type A (vWA) domain
VFVEFFYELRDRGVVISPTAFLRFQKALALGLVASLEDLYVVARTTMVKSEKLFDLYDQVFAHHFRGVEFDASRASEIAEAMKRLLEEWLRDPQALPGLSDEERAALAAMSPEELERYFLDRLRDQTERHDGGDRWIGTGGRSPVGHGGEHPDGMRVGGTSRMQSAIKVAMDRRYADYSKQGVLSPETIGDALRRLRHMVPHGPKDQLDVERTIYETVREGGEIELVFTRRLKDKVKVLLFMDNGGYSMSPYVEVCRVLFQYAHAQFKEVRTFYFHNCIYDRVWEDPERERRPHWLLDFSHFDPEYKAIYVGDASMAIYELRDRWGNIEYGEGQSRSGEEWLRFLARQFPHSVWLNPKRERTWETTIGAQTIWMVRRVFPMFELTLDGLEKAVASLMAK